MKIVWLLFSLFNILLHVSPIVLVRNLKQTIKPANISSHKTTECENKFVQILELNQILDNTDDDNFELQIQANNQLSDLVDHYINIECKDTSRHFNLTRIVSQIQGSDPNDKQYQLFYRTNLNKRDCYDMDKYIKTLVDVSTAFYDDSETIIEYAKKIKNNIRMYADKQCTLK